MKTLALLGLTLAVLVPTAALAPTAVEAQYFDDNIYNRQTVESPENFALEIRLGPYLPSGIAGVVEGSGEFDDEGPMLAAELDVMFLHIPYVGDLGIGGGIGWSSHGGKAATMEGATTDEDLTVTFVPISGLGVLRIDVLARELAIPFIFTGKLGMDAIFWDANRGEVDEVDGIVFGLRWALQVALELDFFEPTAARSLDEEWGINHSFVFFEYYGAEAKGQPVIGDRNWAAGLGFTF